MAKTAFGDLLNDLIQEVKGSGKTVVGGIKDLSTAEGYSQALSAIFDGKPKFYKQPDGKIVYYWEGADLKAAQKRIDSLMSRGGGNVIVDWTPVFAPSIFKQLLPIGLLVGGWLYLRGKK